MEIHSIMTQFKQSGMSAVALGLALFSSLLSAPSFAQSQSDRPSLKPIDYTKLGEKPNRNSINQGLESTSADYMKSKFGIPGALTTNCSPVTNPKLKGLIVTKDVGPFSVTGLKPALSALERVFKQVKTEEPQLYKQLGTAGMICVRKVRGGSDFSNHAWGTAVDIKINNKLDVFGDNKTQLGLKKLYPYFHKEGFYWGAGFKRIEDSMHFEASKQLVEKWTK
jgi:hypothetical protein